MRIPGMELHQSHIERFGGGSLEMIPGHEQAGCPLLYEMTYVQSRPEATTSFQLSYGSAVHQALYYMEDEGMDPDEALKKAWLPELGPERYDEALDDLRNVIENGSLAQIHTIAVEQSLKAVLYEDEEYGPVEFGGRLDVIGVDNEVTEVPRLYVSDYKTNRAPISRADLEGWMQGRSYAWLLREHIDKYLPEADPSEVEIVVMLDAVKWYTLRTSWSNDQLDAWAAWAESVARRILRTKEGKPRLNPGCNFCPVKAECPAWKKLPKVGETLLEKLDAVALEDQIAFLDQAKATKNRLVKAIEEVETRIKERIKSTKEPFVGGSTIYTYEQGQVLEVDLRGLHAALGDDFYSLIKSPARTTLERYTKDHPERFAEVEATKSLVPGNHNLKRSKV